MLLFSPPEDALATALLLAISLSLIFAGPAGYVAGELAPLAFIVVLIIGARVTRVMERLLSGRTIPKPSPKRTDWDE